MARAKTAMIHVRISPRLLQRLDRVLRARGLTRSDWVIGRIQEYLEREERPMMQAVFVTNNAYDTILVDTLAYPALRVTPEVLRAFCEHPGDWRNWSGDMEPWDEYGRTIDEAAREYGQVVAWYDATGMLHVEDPGAWEERRRFYRLE